MRALADKQNALMILTRRYQSLQNPSSDRWKKEKCFGRIPRRIGFLDDVKDSVDDIVVEGAEPSQAEQMCISENNRE